MPNQKHDFRVQTNIGGGIAVVQGTCGYDTDKTDGYYDYCYSELTVNRITLLMGDKVEGGLLAYYMDKNGDYRDAIDTAIHEHMEQVIYGEKLPDGSECYPITAEQDARERNPSICR